MAEEAEFGRGLPEPPEHALDCPGCFMPLFAPVRTCPQGHLLCEFCRSSRGGKCPACGGPVGKKPSCPKADEIVKAVPRPCWNAAAGCEVTAVSVALREHVMQCPLNQACRKCRKKVQNGQMQCHFRSQHPGYILTGEPVPVLMSVDSPQSVAYLLPGEPLAFVVRFHFQDGGGGGGPGAAAAAAAAAAAGTVYLWAAYGDEMAECRHQATLTLTGPGAGNSRQFTVPLHKKDEHNWFSFSQYLPCDRCIELDVKSALDSKFQATIIEL